MSSEESKPPATTTTTVLPAPITTLPQIVTDEDFEDVSIVIANAIPQKYVVEGAHPDLDSATDEFSRRELMRARFDNLPVQMTHMGEHTETGTVRAFKHGASVEVVMGIDTDDSPPSVASENFLFNGYYEDVSVCHDWEADPMYHSDGTHACTVVKKTPIEISLCREGARTGSHIKAFLPSKAAMKRQNWHNLQTFAKNNGLPPPPHLKFATDDFNKQEAQRRHAYPCNTESLRDYVDTLLPLVKLQRSRILANEGYIASTQSHHSIRAAARVAAALNSNHQGVTTGRTKMSNPSGSTTTALGGAGASGGATGPGSSTSTTTQVVGSGTAAPPKMSAGAGGATPAAPASEGMALDAAAATDGKDLDELEKKINKDEELARMIKENGEFRKREQEREEADRKKAAGLAKSEVDLMMTDSTDMPEDLKERLKHSAEDAEEVMRTLPAEQTQRLHNLMFGLRAASKFVPKSAPSSAPPQARNKATKNKIEAVEDSNAEEAKRFEQRRMALLKRELASKQNLNAALSTVNAMNSSRPKSAQGANNRTTSAARTDLQFPHEVGRMTASSGTKAASAPSVSSTVTNPVISRSAGKAEDGRVGNVDFSVVLRDTSEVIRKNGFNQMMTETDWLHGGIVAIATGRVVCNADGEDEEEVEMRHRFQEPIPLPKIFGRVQCNLGPQHCYPDRFKEMKKRLMAEPIGLADFEDMRDFAVRYETENPSLFAQ